MTSRITTLSFPLRPSPLSLFLQTAKESVMRIRKNQLKTENPKSQQTCRHLPPKESRLEPKRTYMGHCGDWDGGDGPRVRKSRKLEPISSGKPFVQV